MAELSRWRRVVRSWFTRRPAPRRGEDAGLGNKGERVAARFLRKAGYRVVQRNVRVRVGEIDLVCLAPDRRTMVFVEVKARRLDDGRPYVPPEEAVTSHKQRKLLQTAGVIARQQKWLDRPLRIDVIAVELPAKGKPTIRHYMDAVKAPARH